MPIFPIFLNIYGKNGKIPIKIFSTDSCKNVRQASFFTFDIFYVVRYDTYIRWGEDIMASKVTIQDIANALGVSRNTVSKAINNTGVLAADTRDKVLKKAQEMGYKQFSYMNITESNKPSPASIKYPPPG